MYQQRQKSLGGTAWVDQKGEALNQLVTDFNKSQNQYAVKPVFKGKETLTAGIAAFRAHKAPNMLMVNEVGSAMLINAKGVIKPFENLMTQYSYKFDSQEYLPGVRTMYADTKGTMLGFPFSISTPVMYVNQDIMKKAGVAIPHTYEEFESAG